MANILVVEDDIDIAKGLAEYLALLGHELDFAYTGNEAQSMLQEFSYHLVLLDLNLPQISGFDICKSLLEDKLTSTPVIIMSANQSEQDILRGFESGAWDYLKKPFSFAELNARIEVALNRSAPIKKKAIIAQGLTLDTDSQSLSDDNGNIVQLHPVGFSIVKVMMTNAPKPVSSSQLIDEVWPDCAPKSNPLRANVYSLKKQFKQIFNQELLHNIKGVGYKFDAEK